MNELEHAQLMGSAPFANFIIIDEPPILSPKDLKAKQREFLDILKERHVTRTARSTNL